MPFDPKIPLLADHTDRVRQRAAVRFIICPKKGDGFAAFPGALMHLDARKQPFNSIGFYLCSAKSQSTLSQGTFQGKVETSPYNREKPDSSLNVQAQGAGGEREGKKKHPFNRKNLEQKGWRRDCRV